MDPQANMAEQIRIARDIIAREDAGESLEDAAELAGRLAELIIALAEWHSKQ